MYYVNWYIVKLAQCIRKLNFIQYSTKEKYWCQMFTYTPITQ